MAATVDTTFLHDVYEFELLGIRLMQSLKTWSDKIAFRNAVHEFLKRDGATIERMGRKAAEFRFQCFFEGPNWRIEYGNLIAKLSDNNTGSMTHPLLGPMQVAVDLLEGSSTPATGRDLVEFALTITENQVDLSLAEEQEPRPLQLSAQAQQSASLAQVRATQDFPQSAPIVSAYVNAVAAYTAAAELALTDPVAALQLEGLLSKVGRSAQLSEQALLLDPNRAVDADIYDVLAEIELGYAAVLTMQEAILSQVVLPEAVTVTVSQPLITWCQQRYGGADALRYAEIIERSNALPDPLWVVQGTELLAPPPTRSLQP